MTTHYKLYGAELSYYTGKVRAYLNYKGIPFEEITASTDIYQRVIVPRTGVNYIPVVITPDDIAIQDSTEIIDFLKRRFSPRAVYPNTPRQRLTALLFELYGDEWLLLPAMHYRWKYNYEFVVKEFGRVTAPDASPEAQRALAEDAINYFRGSCVNLGVTDKTSAAIEAGYEAFLADMERHFQIHPFLLGDRPCIGDFGLIGPLYAHLYRDPASGDLMKKLAPAVARWVERMISTSQDSGEWLSGDQIPETLYPVLEWMFAEHFPVMLDTVKKLSEWLEDYPEKDIPRSIGQHEFTVGKVTEIRDIFPYTQWMLQRPLDFYQFQSSQKNSELDNFLKRVNGLAAMQVKIKQRVKRERNLLKPDPG